MGKAKTISDIYEMLDLFYANKHMYERLKRRGKHGMYAHKHRKNGRG